MYLPFLCCNLHAYRTISSHSTSIYILVGNYSTDAVVVEAALTLILFSFRLFAVHSFDQIGIMCESDWLWVCSWFTFSIYILSLLFFSSSFIVARNFYFFIVRSMFVLFRIFPLLTEEFGIKWNSCTAHHLYGYTSYSIPSLRHILDFYEKATAHIYATV